MSECCCTSFESLEEGIRSSQDTDVHKDVSNHAELKEDICKRDGGERQVSLRFACSIGRLLRRYGVSLARITPKNTDKQLA